MYVNARPFILAFLRSHVYCNLVYSTIIILKLLIIQKYRVMLTRITNEKAFPFDFFYRQFD